MELFNWWKRWKKGDAVCKVASAEALNRVYNVLEGIEAIGLNGIDAQINKPTDAQGRGWTIVVDGNPLKSGIGGDHWGVFDDPTSSTPWETGPETQAEDGVTALFAGATVSRNTADGTLTITPVSRTVSTDSRGNVREIGGESAGASVVLRENMGVDGVGIDDIDSGTSTESGGYTITPITITLTDGTTVDLLVRAKNGADGADGEDGARGPRGPQGEQGPPGPTVQVSKNVVVGVRWNESTHQLEARYSTIVCQGYTDAANWTPWATAVQEMP